MKNKLQSVLIIGLILVASEVVIRAMPAMDGVAIAGILTVALFLLRGGDL